MSLGVSALQETLPIGETAPKERRAWCWRSCEMAGVLEQSGQSYLESKAFPGLQMWLSLAIP